MNVVLPDFLSLIRQESFKLTFPNYCGVSHCTLLITLVEDMQNFIHPPAQVAKEQVSADQPGTAVKALV